MGTKYGDKTTLGVDFDNKKLLSMVWIVFRNPAFSSIATVTSKPLYCDSLAMYQTWLCCMPDRSFWRFHNSVDHLKDHGTQYICRRKLQVFTDHQDL